MIFGSSTIATNQYISGYPQNRDLIMNSLAWLSEEKDLITIERKEINNIPLVIARNQMLALLFICILGIPMLIEVLWIAVHFVRRKYA